MGGIALSPHKAPLMASVHCGGRVLAGKMATNLGKVILLVKMNFPGGPVAKTPTPNSEGTSLIPVWGAKVWLAARHSQKKKNTQGFRCFFSFFQLFCPKVCFIVLLALYLVP